MWHPARHRTRLYPRGLQPLELGTPTVVTLKAYLRTVRKSLQLAGLVACLVAGIVLATALVGSVQAAGTTTTDTATATTETTSEPTTVFTTTTVEQTTTRQIVLPPPTTTSSSSSSSETPSWVWVLLAILAAALIIVIVLLARRGGGGGGGTTISTAERRRRLENAVASWTMQGWALESQGADSAILQRAGERMIVSVDSEGQVTTSPYSPGPAA